MDFVTAGGEFSGGETTGAINDFVREVVRHYPELTEDLIRVVIVHFGEVLLSELGEDWPGEFARSGPGEEQHKRASRLMHVPTMH